MEHPGTKPDEGGEPVDASDAVVESVLPPVDDAVRPPACNDIPEPEPEIPPEPTDPASPPEPTEPGFVLECSSVAVPPHATRKHGANQKRTRLAELLACIDE